MYIGNWNVLCKIWGEAEEMGTICARIEERGKEDKPDLEESVGWVTEKDRKWNASRIERKDVITWEIVSVCLRKSWEVMLVGYVGPFTHSRFLSAYYMSR